MKTWPYGPLKQAQQKASDKNTRLIEKV